MGNSAAITEYWDAAAASFDDEPDHGLRSVAVRAAWVRRLAGWLPPAGERPLSVLDVGCGTGSLSLLMAQAGHRVVGVDLAPEMVARARGKLGAAAQPAWFLVGDAAAPPTRAGRFDVVIARHLLWTLPDPAAALETWVGMLRPGGRLVLVEGRWRESGQAATPYVAGAEQLPWHGGVGAEALAEAVRPLVAELRVESLSDEPALWGRSVDDERYALVAMVA
ncbi:class I SAM-dependent methyltransferase [Kitasatospora sp. McL0602]|uniref:class I SAM-dependent methyltransferase n=1 Tax=Kitasatospora sp. McL0602 TaxID=3439530 RepID=UPI003F8BE5B5